MRTRTLWSYVYLTGVLGLIVAIYAGLETLDPSLRSSCTISSFFSCAAVDSSGHTATLGIPDAVIGIVGFLAILVLAGLAERRSSDRRFVYGLLIVTTAGVGFASYFAYVELAIIHALCPVCTTAYAFGVLVWVGAIALTVRSRGDAAPDRAPVPDGAE